MIHKVFFICVHLVAWHWLLKRPHEEMVLFAYLAAIGLY